MDSPFNVASSIETRANGAELILTSRDGMYSHIYQTRKNSPFRRICVLSLVADYESISKIDDRLFFKILDDPDEELDAIISPCLDFINSNLAIANCTVIVHCMSGISRSASIIVAYIASKYECSIEEAVVTVRQKRPFICPNDGFLAQLEAWHQSSSKAFI